MMTRMRSWRSGAGAGGGIRGCNCCSGDLSHVCALCREAARWRWADQRMRQMAVWRKYSLPSVDRCLPKMKYESGVHRVQRVCRRLRAADVSIPPPSARGYAGGGWWHDIVIEDKEVRIDVMRASVTVVSVYTTDSQYVWPNYPSGIVVYSQTEKLSIQNKAKAFALLKLSCMTSEQQRHDAEKRRAAAGSVLETVLKDPYLQLPLRSCVTDHRIGSTRYRLGDKIMNEIKRDHRRLHRSRPGQPAKLAKMNEE